MSIEQQEQRMDWHPADIIAALRKRKTTLAAVSREAGLSSSTLANALNRPWPNRYFDSQGQRIPREIRHKNN
ncbi:helix-turn-helix domain-containing protein [Pectobacterium polaris]|uniref:helix-turn-helix domain-containing protein n=1 Tax=Pectobacterium polaris TaxID=2042057 RepID=UPI001F2E1BD8|nr:helix-turn-helix domain-containing protein [Pectobacterium polaris]